MEINKVYNGDSLELIKSLHKEIDCIITDPPYNISMDNNFKTMGRSGIDFGEWDKEFNLTNWIKPCVDKLKKGGNIIIFNDWKNMSYIKDELINCGCLIKEMIMWKKTNPMPRNRDRLYVTTCEFAIWATKGKGWTYNRQRDTYENAIFEYPVVSSKKRFHPTQKPEQLMEDLIKIHSNENDIVFDPFMGSGTTLVSAKNLHRQYIGFELDENYYKVTEERLNKIN
jgi:DNA modification methylase